MLPSTALKVGYLITIDVPYTLEVRHSSQAQIRNNRY